MSELDAALAIFAQEAEELLISMEDALLILESNPTDSETINSLFRAMHTIKGSAGLFGFSAIVSFTHEAESLLDKVRNGEQLINPELISVLLDCKDHTTQLIAHCLKQNDTPIPTALLQQGQRLIALLGGGQVANLQAVEDTHLEVEPGSELAVDSSWLISLEFKHSAFRNGMDPMSFIRYLKTLGEIKEMITILHDMPKGEEMDAENCYLYFKIAFLSDASKQTIESVFEFVADDCDIKILPPYSKIDEYSKLLAQQDESHVNLLGEMLIRVGALTQHEVKQALQKQSEYNRTEQAAPKPLGQILVEQQMIQQPVVEQALHAQEQTKQKIAAEANYIRVDAAKLGHLIDLVGELVISTAAASLRGMMSGDIALQEVNASVISLVEEVRDSALQLRMVPIGTTFSRFQRVVRDLSKELGKDIRLEISGAETEVDKSVVEKIADPLLHLVRNAIDHGIERSEVRVQRGKPMQGTLKLNAYHSSGNIVIEVSDDGGGLNREKIYAKALEKGLIKDGDPALSDQDIYALIFEPGFSTVDQVSNLSGRGVGMDVVKRNVMELRGAVHIDSQLGQGTTLRINLPLTLAIIDGFLVGVGDASYVIPLDRVVECVELRVDDDHDYMELRGEVLPFIRLKKLFKKSGPVAKRQNIIVVEHLGLKAGLVVDKLMGELQTVIKPLGKLFSHVQGIGGSTILGSGEVALIIDVPTLLKRHQEPGMLSNSG